MNAVLLFVLFATPVVFGAVIGAWTYWLPRHRLNKIFAECKRARLARLASEHALEALT